MAKAPRPRSTEESEHKALTIVVNGERYAIRLDEVTAVDSAALRKATGMSLRFILDALNTDADLDIVAALVWFAKLQAGERESFATICASINYNVDLKVETGADEDEGADDPQR